MELIITTPAGGTFILSDVTCIGTALWGFAGGREMVLQGADYTAAVAR